MDSGQVPETSQFDLTGLRLATGEGRRLGLGVRLEPVVLGDVSYSVEPPLVPVMVEVSRMAGTGYALRLQFTARITGPCMRCLAEGDPSIEVDVREVDKADAGDELESPYVTEETLEVAAWARDALVLAMPVQVLCREDCAGLCPVCAVDLNVAEPGHKHEPEPDPRLDKLRELKLD
jgi:uncharacterized protein